MDDILPMGKQKTKRGRRPKAPQVFSKNFRRLLEEKKISVTRAASIIGTSKSVVSGWQAGAMPNDPSGLLKLCQELGADFQYLMTGVPSSAIPASRLGEIFEIEDSPEYSGVFLLEAKRLKWRKSK